MNVQVALDQSIEYIIQLQYHKNVMLQFFTKHMNCEGLKLNFIDIYEAAFTVSELKDISAFYATTTGEKTKMSPLIEAERRLE